VGVAEFFPKGTTPSNEKGGYYALRGKCYTPALGPGGRVEREAAGAGGTGLRAFTSNDNLPSSP